jgi:hypothetical protein
MIKRTVGTPPRRIDRRSIVQASPERTTALDSRRCWTMAA